jgi:hypothetical protein
MKDLERIATEAALACGRDKDHTRASICATSIVVARCTCGWFDYFGSLDESPDTCPTCSRNSVIRSQTDMNEIIPPIVTVN